MNDAERPQANISDLRLALMSERPTILYRRSAGVFDERVRSVALGYRTFVANGKIYTDVLCETTSGEQEFIPLSSVTFIRTAAQAQRPVDESKPF